MSVCKALRFRIFLYVVNGIYTAQLALTTASNVGDVLAKLQKAEEIVETALLILARRGLIEGRNAPAKLLRLLHPTILHARRERVDVVLVILQLHFVRKDALPLADGQLQWRMGDSLLHSEHLKCLNMFERISNF